MDIEYVTIWRLSYRNVGTHANSQAVQWDTFFKTKESLDKYMEAIPNGGKVYYQVSDALAVKKGERYFPLEKPITFL